MELQNILGQGLGVATNWVHQGFMERGATRSNVRMSVPAQAAKEMAVMLAQF